MVVRLKLNELLSDRNLSHRQFASMVGIRHPTISQMSNNQSKMISLDNLDKICKTLECNISDILKKEPE